jgi:hypothetical protein
MLMMDSLRTKNLAVPAFGEDDVQVSASYEPRQPEKRGDNKHLALILAFLGREVEQSATLLRDLAEKLSDDFSAICSAETAEEVQDRLVSATMALQNEDRLQQRLSDLGTAIIVLERTLVDGMPASQADIDRAIIDKLRLDETRSAFASSMGLADGQHQPSKVTKEPSIGDIDLF